MRGELPIKWQKGWSINFAPIISQEGFPGGSEGKASARNVGNLGSIPESGRSPGEGNGNQLQYSCLENSMDREAEWAKVHGLTESDRIEQLTLSLSY